MLVFTEKLLGIFREKEKGNFFTFTERETSDNWLSLEDYPHYVHVIDGVRYARVLKTVAYIVVDESNDGKPIIEKWQIKHTAGSLLGS